MTPPLFLPRPRGPPRQRPASPPGCRVARRPPARPTGSVPPAPPATERRPGRHHPARLPAPPARRTPPGQLFMAGHGIFAIAEMLTADGIPCPSAHDRARNKHRCGIAWSKSAVRAILTNPRHTGHQVWNRQRKDEVLHDINDVTLGHTTKMRWNEAGQWIYSDEIVHPPVINDETFKNAQDVLAGRGRGPCQHRPHDVRRAYAFGGSIFCAVCRRRMQGQWINQASYYRCRFPAEYALANKVDHPRNVYVREDAFDAQVNSWIAGLFDPSHIHETIDLITAAQDNETDDSAADAAKAAIADANERIARYKAAIDANGDPAEIGAWITEAKARRVQAEAELRRTTSKARVTRQQIEELINMTTDVAATLHNAEPAQIADAYRKLGVRLTYDPAGPLIRATVSPQAGNIGKWSVSEGDLNTETGEISLVRGNHATKVTRAGPARTVILPGFRYSSRYLAYAQPGGRCEHRVHSGPQPQPMTAGPTGAQQPARHWRSGLPSMLSDAHVGNRLRGTRVASEHAASAPERGDQCPEKRSGTADHRPLVPMSGRAARSCSYLMFGTLLATQIYQAPAVVRVTMSCQVVSLEIRQSRRLPTSRWCQTI
jgi:Recombinase